MKLWLGTIVFLLFLSAFAVYFRLAAHLSPIIRPGEAGIPKSKSPHVVLESFQIENYAGKTLKGSLSAAMGFFEEPNILEVYGDIRGKKIGSEVWNLSAGSGRAFFGGRGLSEILQSSQLQKAEAFGQVRLSKQDFQAESDYVVLDPVKNTLSSDLGVKIKNHRSAFFGEKGFEYQLSNEVVELFGPIHGQFKEEPLP